MQSAIQTLARKHARIVARIDNATDDTAAAALWEQAREIERTLANITAGKADRAHALSVVANAMQVSGETDLARIVRAAIL